MGSGFSDRYDAISYFALIFEPVDYSSNKALIFWKRLSCYCSNITVSPTNSIKMILTQNLKLI